LSGRRRACREAKKGRQEGQHAVPGHGSVCR
jgi:hypothetical protein